ncbi:hypothetical protein K491DRAFT_452485 [Lophiostoma macrostomum CBS 122681]|uniref:F-box domain-containing protein n=1 Tax=Lophiostoma macrostomum CBS 122681 TaxID=1314788 RepID=A0A6A6TNK3_9PLEO|nr:hypothetical protein K491DRAFT_452485 [Lophiostoma macrostomum CBS 122681]
MFRHFSFTIRPFQNNIKTRILYDANFLIPIIAKLRVDMGTVADWAIFPTRDLERGSKDHLGTLQSFLEMLPQKLTTATALNSLAFDFTDKWQTDFDEGKNDAPLIWFPMLDHLRSGLSRVFKSTIALSENLVDLQLSLPCTYGFAVVAEAISDDTLARLRHLRLQVVDGTGIGGPPGKLVNNYTKSNLLEEYPNEEYAPAVAKIISKCKNLRTLGVSGTQHLDCDAINWQPSAGGLDTLHLQRVSLTSKTLIKLLSSAKNYTDRSSLFCTWLEEVRLKAGTWAEVFKHMRNCPSLRYTNMHHLEYDEDGESRHLRSYVGHMDGDYEKIWTVDKEDRKEMTSVMEYVIARSGQYPNEFNEVAVWDEYYSDGTEGWTSGFILVD